MTREQDGWKPETMDTTSVDTIIQYLERFRTYFKDTVKIVNGCMFRDGSFHISIPSVTIDIHMSRDTLTVDIGVETIIHTLTEEQHDTLFNILTDIHCYYTHNMTVYNKAKEELLREIFIGIVRSDAG